MTSPSARDTQERRSNTRIRVFIGATEAQLLAVRVLEYSIRKHCSQPLELLSLDAAILNSSADICNSGTGRLGARTPFSLQRFAIPQLCGYQGRAFYLDSDMLVARDMAEAWSQPMPRPVRAALPRPGRLRLPQLSVMLLDCSRLDWRVEGLVSALNAGEIDYRTIMDGTFMGDSLSRSLPAYWNDLEYYVPGETALVHYTDMPRQPWLDSSNPLGHLWCRSLLEALDTGFLDRNTLDSEIAAGNVRPSLAWQVDHGCVDPRRIVRAERVADRMHFLPPHRQPGRHPGRLEAEARLVAAGLGLRQALAQTRRAARHFSTKLRRA